jgi:hypothetical protein
MSRSSSNLRAEGSRVFSLYGVNQNDRVAECTHFNAANLQDAVDRAQAQVERFPKVELWVGCDCVWVAARPPAAQRLWRSLPSWTRSAGRKASH